MTLEKWLAILLAFSPLLLVLLVWAIWFRKKKQRGSRTAKKGCIIGLILISLGIAACTLLPWSEWWTGVTSVNPSTWNRKMVFWILGILYALPLLYGLTGKQVGAVKWFYFITGPFIFSATVFYHLGERGRENLALMQREMQNERHSSADWIKFQKADGKSEKTVWEGNIIYSNGEFSHRVEIAYCDGTLLQLVVPMELGDSFSISLHNKPGAQCSVGEWTWTNPNGKSVTGSAEMPNYVPTADKLWSIGGTLKGLPSRYIDGARADTTFTFLAYSREEFINHALH